jgi:hypothetical protein
MVSQKRDPMRVLLLYIFLFAGIQCHAQKSNIERIKLSGQVTTAHGEPIKNAVLYIDSVKTFVRTNKKGRYNTKIAKDTKTIMVYSAEHGVNSRPYAGKAEMDFQFADGNEPLTEQDLEALGYLTEAPRKGMLSPSRFKEFSNIYQLIREMFTGVEVNGSNIVVRGVSSFGDTTPLFVVDDSYVSDISFIQPAEVESIVLLKGEDTAIYGSRGANGVFLIRLKK